MIAYQPERTCKSRVAEGHRRRRTRPFTSSSRRLKKYKGRDNPFCRKHSIGECEVNKPPAPKESKPMEKQLSFGLEGFSAGILRNEASRKKHLSSKGQKEPKQSVNGLLPSKKKEFKLKSLSLDELLKQPSKESKFFDNRIHKLLSTREASGLLGVSENALRILVCRKKVKAYKLGSRLKFRHGDLVDCLQKKEV